MKDTYVILNCVVATFKKAKGEINFNNIFYLTQYV